MESAVDLSSHVRLEISSDAWFYQWIRITIFCELRTQLLVKIEQDLSITLQQLIDEYDGLFDLKKNLAMIQQLQPSSNPVHAVNITPSNTAHPKHSSYKKLSSGCCRR